MITTKTEELELYLQNLNTDESFIDAVVDFCEMNNIDIEHAGTFISKTPGLLAKVEVEAIGQRLIKSNTNKLPL